MKSIEDWAKWWGLPPTTPATYDHTYIEAAIQAGEGGTGIFGMRSMWDSVEPLLARLAALNGSKSALEQLEYAFGRLKFIHLSRTDRVAQAVSLTIAEQSGLWHRNADGTVLEQTKALTDPIYDHDAIAREYDGLTVEAAGWARWFERINFTPHRVTYETLAADPQNAVAAILGHIGLDPLIAQSLQPGTAKLGNRINREWASRFRAETGLPPADQPS